MVDGWVVLLDFVSTFMGCLACRFGWMRKKGGRELTPGIVGSVIPLGCQEVLGRV